jgi:hypothetical protein
VTAPNDILGGGGGILSSDLRQAALDALALSREDARQKALTFSWSECARQFLSNLAGVPKSAFAGGGRRLRSAS